MVMTREVTRDDERWRSFVPGMHEIELDVEYPDGLRGTVRRQAWDGDEALGAAFHSAIRRELVDIER